MNLKICISSCKEYGHFTVPNLLRSISNSGFDLKDVVVVEGNNEHESIENQQATLIKVKHNSFDLTALLAIGELQLQAEGWLLLHDTCVVGNNFAQLLFQQWELNKDKDRTALISFPSMSIGIYKHEFLQNNFLSILPYKSYTKTKDDVIAAKTKAFSSEDVLLWRLNEGTIGCMGNTRVVQTVNKSLWNFNFNEGRMQEYFPQLDLYKLKANYGQEGSSIVTL